MNVMKRALTVLMAVVMVLTMTVTALAAGVEDAGGISGEADMNVAGKAINASSAEVGNLTSTSGEIKKNTDHGIVVALTDNLRDDELAPYVFKFILTDSSVSTITIGNIVLKYPYKFLRVWYKNGGDTWKSVSGSYNPTDKTVTFSKPTGFTEGPIAITVVRSTGGGGGSSSGGVPVSPQTGEIGSSVYLLGAAVMAAACAAFVVKSRKAA